MKVSTGYLIEIKEGTDKQQNEERTWRRGSIQWLQDYVMKIRLNSGRIVATGWLIFLDRHDHQDPFGGIILGACVLNQRTELLMDADENSISTEQNYRGVAWLYID